MIRYNRYNTLSMYCTCTLLKAWMRFESYGRWQDYSACSLLNWTFHSYTRTCESVTQANRKSSQPYELHIETAVITFDIFYRCGKLGIQSMQWQSSIPIQWHLCPTYLFFLDVTYYIAHVLYMKYCEWNIIGSSPHQSGSQLKLLSAQRNAHTLNIMLL